MDMINKETLKEQGEFLLKNSITLLIKNIAEGRDFMKSLDLKNLVEWQILSNIDEYVMKKIALPIELTFIIKDAITFTLTYYLKEKFISQKNISPYYLIKIFIYRIGGEYLVEQFYEKIIGDYKTEEERFTELRSSHDGDIKNSGDFTTEKKVQKK